MPPPKMHNQAVLNALEAENVALLAEVDALIAKHNALQVETVSLVNQVSSLRNENVVLGNQMHALGMMDNDSFADRITERRERLNALGAQKRRAPSGKTGLLELVAHVNKRFVYFAHNSRRTTNWPRGPMQFLWILITGY